MSIFLHMFMHVYGIFQMLLCAFETWCKCHCMCTCVHIYDGLLWLRWQTEQTAGLHTRHMSWARCYDSVAPTAPRIPGGQSGCKLETVCTDLIHATHTHTHTHTHTRLACDQSCPFHTVYLIYKLQNVSCQNCYAYVTAASWRLLPVSSV